MLLILFYSILPELVLNATRVNIFRQENERHFQHYLKNSIENSMIEKAILILSLSCHLLKTVEWQLVGGDCERGCQVGCVGGIQDDTVTNPHPAYKPGRPQNWLLVLT